MKPKTANSRTTNKSPNNKSLNNRSQRCLHRTPSGRQCRSYALDADSPFCFRHASLRSKDHDTADVSAALAANVSDFNDPAQIGDFLSKLLLLLSRNEIASRRAAVLAYICNLLLRTHLVMAQEQEEQPPSIIWDMPRPDREDQVESFDPSNANANNTGHFTPGSTMVPEDSRVYSPAP